jgi:hypothetical protein
MPTAKLITNDTPIPAGNKLIGSVAPSNSLVISDGSITPILRKVIRSSSITNTNIISGVVGKYTTVVGINFRVIPNMNLQLTDSSSIFNTLNLGGVKVLTPLKLSYLSDGFSFTTSNTGANLGYSLFPQNIPDAEFDMTITYIITDIANPLS